MNTSGQSAISLPATHEALLSAFLSTGQHHNVHIVAADKVSTGSRNSLLRLTLDGLEHDHRSTLIAKHVARETDPFFAHHLRREERILDLLHRFAPGLAPRCVGLLLQPTDQGWLLMEDVGCRSLAVALVSTHPNDGTALIHDATRQLRRLHDVLQEHHSPFFRTCYAVDLDRLTRTSLRSRFQVAWKRLSTHVAAPSEPPPGLIHAWLDIMRPLLDSPRQLIHNSLSPLNIVVRDDGGMTLVDFETMTVAAPEFDTAELLRQPFQPLTWDDTLRLASAQGLRDTAHVSDRLHLASLSRALDYAGSNVRQLAVQAERGAPPETRNQIRARLLWYCAEISNLIDTWPALDPLHALIHQGRMSIGGE
ncbi:MAG: hypothetical protein NVSMB52_13210 [Chloroflexota bacterium]